MTGAGLWPQRASYPVLVWRLALRPAGFVFGVRAAAGTSGTAGLLSNDLYVVIRMDKQVGVYHCGFLVVLRGGDRYYLAALSRWC